MQIESGYRMMLGLCLHGMGWVCINILLICDHYIDYFVVICINSWTRCNSQQRWLNSSSIMHNVIRHSLLKIGLRNILESLMNGVVTIFAKCMPNQEFIRHAGEIYLHSRFCTYKYQRSVIRRHSWTSFCKYNDHLWNYYLKLFHFAIVEHVLYDI